MITHIITDIEGTTTDVKFVTDVLFPYSRSRMHEFLHAHQAHSEVVNCIEGIRFFLRDPQADIAKIADQCVLWIDEDVKNTHLKILQGLIWVSGYESGVLKGHVYEDAKRQLEMWREAGIVLGIYSSGSVQAQKLLFRHSTWGDLSVLFSHFFDTQIGAKREVGSYQYIEKDLGVRPNQLLFISDIYQELDAASSAGLLTMGINRYGREGVGTHPTVSRFNQIDLKFFEV